MPYPQASESMKLRDKLLKQLENKEITQDEFMKECAYWALQTLDEYKPISHPLIPDQLKEYFRMSDNQKAKVPDKFWHEPEIWHHLEEMQLAVNTNRSNFYWLHEWLRYIPEEDDLNRQKLKHKISQFKVFFDMNQNKFYKKNQRKENIKEESNKELVIKKGFEHIGDIFNAQSTGEL